MNPILYNLMSSKFREGFVKLLGCKPLMRTTSWSDGTRKGTFHTTSTNLSSSNHGNAAVEAQRLRKANLSANEGKGIERAPLNAIKYVKIVVIESIEGVENVDYNSDVDLSRDKREDTASETTNVNSSTNLSINSYPNKQKSNYGLDEIVKISINPCNNDKCLSDELCDGIDGVPGQEKDFCINIYKLLSAEESLV